MRIWITLTLILWVGMVSISVGAEIFPNDSLPLNLPSHLDNTLADWDSVWVVICRADNRLDSVKLSSDGNGRWSGWIVLSSYTPGAYNKEYCGYYEGDVMCDVEDFGVVNVDSMQGPAAGLDTTQIREMLRYNWDTDSSGSWDMVDSLDQTITAICTPTGENTVIIYVKDIADSTGISHFLIYFKDSVTGAEHGYTYTNSAGVCTVGLSDGSYRIYLKAPGWTITSPVYKTVTTDLTLTYYATEITPSPPPVDSVCVVYGYVKELDGSAAIGAKVEVWMDKTGVTYHGILLDVKIHKVVYTDTTGRFEFSQGIYPNDCLLPANTRWSFKVTSRTGNTLYQKTTEVPIGDSWQLTF